ncbi:MAG: Gfo/Idh/MocA family oxidoreductase [Clostridia bacterium]|nr:Gfo/Idh/MocA family oxidoreductase [Clostridia bacterium]
MLKVGIIGCGFMGGMHAACYDVLEGVKLCAVADARGENAAEMAEKYGAKKVYTTGKDLIEDADVDIVDICLPTFLHTEHAVLAMKKGKNVFIEKPVCFTKEEGKILLEMEKETGAKVQVGQGLRFADEWVWLKEAVSNNTYGKMKTAVFRRLSPSPNWGWENWLHNVERSGSVALDMHVHDVDFMRYLFGEPDSFTATAQRNDKGIIEHIFTTYTYDKSVVTIEGCWDFPVDFPFEESYRIKFEKGTAVYKLGEGVTFYPTEGGSEKIEIKPSFEGVNDIGGNVSSLGEYYNELKYFTERIASGEPLLVATLSDAVKSVELALAEIAQVGGAQI